MKATIFYCTIVQLLLIIWKLNHLLNVAWWIVLLPTLGPIGIVAGLLILLLWFRHCGG